MREIDRKSVKINLCRFVRPELGHRKAKPQKPGVPVR